MKGEEMQSLRKAAHQALDFFERKFFRDEFIEELEQSITALRAALAEDRSADTGKTSDHFAGATKMVATSQQSRQVEPVAYVTGFSKGYATVRPVDPCLLMCVGMALYRSPPTISKTETVEPVAWIGCLEGGIEYGTYHKAALKLPDGVRFDLYTAPTKREPLTDWEIEVWAQKPISRIALCRAIERAHGIVGDE